MLSLDVGRAGHVSNCAADFQYAIVSSCAQARPRDGHFHELLSFGTERAVLTNHARAHLRVAVNTGCAFESAPLHVPRLHHPDADIRRGLTVAAPVKLFERNGRDLDVQVDAVHQRTADLREVTLHLYGRVHALSHRIVQMAARARVHAGDEHEAGRITHC